ncbi:MAG: S-layer homology domain-containing protein [Clostridia bacterium]|nr:S-layer homology domain-containing protein [Clostridia bacterium]
MKKETVMTKHKSNFLSRIITVFLAISMLFSGQIFFAAQAFGGEKNVIYVSPEGNDENGDGSFSAPFATIKKAFSVVDGNIGATVVLMGDVESDNPEAWNKAYDAIDGHQGLITFTGKDPVGGNVYENAKLRYDTPGFEGPVLVEYLTLVPKRDYAFIDTHGHPFTVGKGVSHEKYIFCIHDGINPVSKVTKVEKTDTVIESGDITHLYVGGAYAKDTTNGVRGDCRLTVNGGTIKTVTIGFDSYSAAHTTASVAGDVVITINGGSVNNIISSKLNDEKIGGALTIILNNSSKLPAIDLPEAEKGTFIINVDHGGSVFATDEPGVFGFKCASKNTCFVNDEKPEGATFKVSPGTHTVAFRRERTNDGELAYINGFPDNTFRPDEKLTRAQAAQIAVKAADKEGFESLGFVSKFSDIKQSDWYYPAIAYLEENEILPKEWQNEFLPNKEITRGEYLYILDGMLVKYNEAIKLVSFSDVTEESTPYYSAIMSAFAAGCVVGYEDGTFRPENALTRAEAVTFVNRYLERSPCENINSDFTDMKGHWADGEVLAASTDKSENKWTVSQKDNTASFVMPESADSAEDYITALYDQAGNLSGKAIREGSAEIAERMKADILNSPNTLELYGDRVTGTAYHISERGDDVNGDGSEEKPFRSIAGLKAKISLKKGDAVLFERGGIYRCTFSVSAGVVYGAYGKGNKPIIMQSKKNYASPELWKETEWENVWVCTELLKNVGIIGFDHDLQDYSESTYNELYGVIMNKNLFGFKDASQLCGDLQFYSELNGGTDNYGELYVYSKNGNPGERFKSIEIGEKIDIVTGSARDVVIDNISFKFTGAHGMGGAGGAENRVVTNCIYSWLGGSVLSLSFEGGKPVNYGNAVEIYGGCNGYYVENNWMYQIYDTAVTHQRNQSLGDCMQENIRYSGNLMEYVYWGIEFYNRKPSASQLGGKEDTYTRITRNVTSEYNLLRLGGYGWGSITRHRTCKLYCGYLLSENYDCYTRYNIFDRAYGDLMYIEKESNELDDKNIYIQHIGQPLGKLKKDEIVTCDYDAALRIAKDLGDKNAVVVLIDPEKDPIVRNIPEGLIAPDALG